MTFHERLLTEDCEMKEIQSKQLDKYQHSYDA